jgi:two-component system sensor histidine kinase YcbA
MSQAVNTARKHGQDAWFLCLIVIICSQLSLHIFTDSFRVSIAAVCLPVFLYLLDRPPMVRVTLISSAGVYVLRVATYWYMGSPLQEAMTGALPEAVFYLMLGSLYTLYDWRRQGHFDLDTFFMPVFVFDYLSNCFELILRFQAGALDSNKQLAIMLVAAARTMMVWGVLAVLDRYRLTLLRRSHAERYQRLILLVSSLHGELVWMQKNVGLIEKTMDTAYSLYGDLKDRGGTEISRKALSVAKDVHEVKKEYLLIMRGIGDALDKEAQEDGMSFAEIMTIMEESMRPVCDQENVKLSIEHDFDQDLFTQDPYYFLAIFRNLVSNAVEATDKPQLAIQIREFCREGEFVFLVADDGPGVDPAIAGHIFDPGFSTKINFETGAISRGLGLSIIRDIVEQGLEGEIDLLGPDDPDRWLVNHPGAVFRIAVPEDSLEVID